MRDERDDRYLWDGSGDPDPSIVRLEETLGRLSHRGAPPRVSALEAEMETPRRWRVPALLGLAAAVVLLASAVWLFYALSRTSWDVARLAGTPTVDGRTITGGARLPIGGWLVTDAASRARIAAGPIGRVEVDPNTRVQLVAARPSEHRLSLERGTIHARIWAPPKFFFVNTPAATAIDLGCAYTLRVEDDGSGLLKVTHGWVGFERDGREAYVPRGAVCATRPGVGPGTPRYEDAPSGYGEALDVLDFGAPDAPGRAAALELVLSRSHRRDALTLWHLLTRGTPDERARVYDRLAALVPPPDGVTRARALAGDRTALGLWWDALGVDVGTWWRLLKKKW